MFITAFREMKFHKRGTPEYTSVLRDFSYQFTKAKEEVLKRDIAVASIMSLAINDIEEFETFLDVLLSMHHTSVREFVNKLEALQFHKLMFSFRQLSDYSVAYRPMDVEKYDLLMDLLRQRRIELCSSD